MSPFPIPLPLFLSIPLSPQLKADDIILYIVIVNSKRKNKERIGDLEYVTGMGVKDTANTDEVKADILNTFFQRIFS